MKKRFFSILLVVLSLSFVLTFTSCDFLSSLLEMDTTKTEDENKDNNNSDTPDNPSNPENPTNPDNPSVTDNDFLLKPTKQVAAKTNYSTIDSYVISCSIPATASISSAAATITQNATTEKEKVRAIFTWIANNISYDVEAQNNTSYNHNEANTAEATLKNRKALCQGYANLFVEMCKAENIKADYVSGNDKKSGYVIGDILGNHAWNCVTLSTGEKLLVDVTWAAGNTIDNVFTKSFKDSWFDVDPSYMILSHHPENTNYQNLTKYITKDDFCNLPRVDPSFEKLGIDGSELLDFLLTHKNAWAPGSYNYLESLDYGVVKAVSLPMTDYLAPSTEYLFNFTYKADDTLYLKAKETNLGTISFGTAFSYSENAVTKADTVNLFHNGNGILFYKVAPGKKGTGLERGKNTNAGQTNTERDDCTIVGNSKVFVYDDQAVLIDSLPYHGSHISDGKYTFQLYGGFINVFEGNAVGDVGDSIGYYDIRNQWWVSIEEGSSLEKNPKAISFVFSKVDSTIPYWRTEPDYKNDMSVCVVPLSKKEELLKKIEAFKNYNWEQDEEMTAFVNWMKEKKYDQSTINFYIDKAKYPSQRGFSLINCGYKNSFEGFSYLGVDSYHVTEESCAGGMERYFLTRELCDHTLWQQDEIPLLIMHYVDTKGSEVNLKPWEDVNTLIKDWEERFASFMPNKLKCYIVEVPYDYSKGDYDFGDSDELIEFEDIIKKASPEVYNAVKGKKYASLDWYDNAKYRGRTSEALLYSAEANTWKLFMKLYENGDLMHLQHDALFTTDNNNRPKCLANDCDHVNAICPLCFYALGY